MSTDVRASVSRDNVQVYPSILFQVDRLSTIEAAKYSIPPYFLYSGYCMGIYDLRQNDYITDLNNTNPITHQAKAYQIINEPEPFPDNHMEFECARADRAALTRAGS